jgi:integrase
MGKKTTGWERTAVQCLLRNRKSGRYYGRWVISGKQKWVSLDTDVFSVAKLRLTDEASKVGRRRGSRNAVETGAGTVGDLMAVYEERTKANADLRPTSIASRLVALKKVRKTWPGLAALKPSQVTHPAVVAWVSRFKAEGTGYVPPGAKTALQGNSPTSVNRAIDTLRRLMDIALERGAIFTNPVSIKPTEGRLKKKVQRKELILPSTADVQRLFPAMEANGSRGGWGMEAADFCRFMAFTGCRVGEVPRVTWSCLDWDNRVLHIPGFKTDTSDRTIPMFTELEKLLQRLIERRTAAAAYAVGGKPFLAPSDPLFRISECQKTIDRACAELGIQRVTHHDFRHLFATRCIESGVDIPTVAAWLGHADGGALLMKTYSHHRRAHSLVQAAKVNFGGAF